MTSTRRRKGGRGTTLYVRNLPPDLKRLFRAKVYARGRNIEQVIGDLMRYYLEYPERVDPKED